MKAVECLSLYADSSGSNILFLIKCSLSLPDTTFSMTFEINVKLNTGRFFFKIWLSKLVYFKSGRMSAVLSDLGIRESRNDILTMPMIAGTNSAMHSFRSQVGNGSS